jgi:hypothetical protein
VLEALQVRIAERLAPLDAVGLTETLNSLTGRRDVSATVVAHKLTDHLVREIMFRGSRGAPLAPLADQQNHDVTHLQGQRLEGTLAQLMDLVRKLAEVDSVTVMPRKPVRLPPRPAFLAGREELLAELDIRLSGGDDPEPRIVAPLRAGRHRKDQCGGGVHASAPGRCWGGLAVRRPGTRPCWRPGSVSWPRSLATGESLTPGTRWRRCTVCSPRSPMNGYWCSTTPEIGHRSRDSCPRPGVGGC